MMYVIDQKYEPLCEKTRAVFISSPSKGNMWRFLTSISIHPPHTFESMVLSEPMRSENSILSLQSTQQNEGTITTLGVTNGKEENVLLLSLLSFSVGSED